MVDEKNFRFLLSVVLCLLVGVYFLVTEFAAQVLGKTLYEEIGVYIRIGTMIVSSICIVSSTVFAPFVRIVFRQDYIHGKYEGESVRIDVNNQAPEKHFEKFSIRQTLINTTIKGVSRDENRDFYSHWNGYLISRKNRQYDFFVNMTRPGPDVSSIITLTVQDDEMLGYVTTYNAENPNKWKFQVKKVS